MSLSADDITRAEKYTKQTVVKRWLILMLYSCDLWQSLNPYLTMGFDKYAPLFRKVWSVFSNKVELNKVVNWIISSFCNVFPIMLVFALLQPVLLVVVKSSYPSALY